MSTRVVVTGMGIISPVGTGLDRFWEAITSGRSGIDRVSSFDTTDFSSKIGGEVRDFDPLDYMDKREARRMDRYAQFAVAAARMALEDSGLVIDASNAERVGVIASSGIGGMHTFEAECRKLDQEGPRRISPAFIPMMISNIAAGQIAIMLGVKGPNFAVTSACATSSHALAEAARIIQSGDADVMIAGGSEAAITPLSYAGFCANRALSTRNDSPAEASCPFDAKRDGFVMGEGAGLMILESYEHARSRGARIYAELKGYGMSADAHHIVEPEPEGRGAALAMRLAMKKAGVSPESIDYINAHGTSTPKGDICETLAIKAALGESSYKVKVSSTKSMTGHLLGAAGGVEAIVSVLAIRDQIVPPTINLVDRDPECDLDYVPNKAVRCKVDVAISNSFGFGGQNAVLLFARA